MVFHLGFLHTDNVRLAGGQPIQQLRQADVEGIDVSGGKYHIGAQILASR